MMMRPRYLQNFEVGGPCRLLMVQLDLRMGGGGGLR